MSKRLNTSVLFLLLLLFVPAAAQAAPGDLDPTFGSGGTTTTDFGARSDFGLGAVLQPDGKIVVAGNSGALTEFAVDFALARYNADGSLDPTFGTGGTVRSDFGSRLDAAFDVALQPDGKVIAVGVTGAFSPTDFAVARYTATGELDATFGTFGVVKTDFDGSTDQATAVAVQPDGKIVVAGPTAIPGTFGTTDFALARYNGDGTLDSTFGNGGKIVTDLGSFDIAQDLVLTDGKIVVAGRSGSRFAVARYNADGSLDTGFGGGIVKTPFAGGEAQAFAIATDATGKLTLVGVASNDFALARYADDGSLDPTFGGDGTVTVDISAGSFDSGLGIVAHPDGTMTAVGSTSSDPASALFAVAHLTAKGALDATFGSGGVVTTSFTYARSTAWDVLLQPDGKLVAVGGTTAPTGAADFAVARYLGLPTAIHVTVDVKPDSSDNVVTLQSNGVVPVAILSTADFDATTVDPSSVCFVRACVEKHGIGHLEDVNLDGRVDLLLHYGVAETGIAAGDTQACLTGRTRAGTAVEGCDSIRTK